MRPKDFVPALFGIVPMVIAMVAWAVHSIRSRQRARLTAAVDAELKATGAKARAMVLNARFGGMIENRVNFRTVVDFQVEPIGGGASFAAQRTMMFTQVNMPQIGSVWPAWYDAADHSRFVVEAPQGISPNQIPLYREFGIPHPLDKG